ncbi:MAG: type II toxin-antitoxin system RelE/ParE family toxin [Alphaproteobacteria bacterium]|nr:type II toxin-antitoxin system RelE/ParE family toxin [Alphaproteobacteria bacterium]
MIYRVLWSERVKKDLLKLGSAEVARITKKVVSHLAKDPLSLGKPLSGNFSGLHSYRIGDYRVLYSMRQDELVIIVLHAGHRKDVYED